MHFSLMMDGDYRQGWTPQEVFAESLAQAELAEKVGLDGVWLAERHFSPPDGSGGPVPSVAAAPMLLATAIAARTRRLRIGIAVYLLPLNHPLRIAEEVATIDQISGGRFDMGVGRSALPRAYDGYNIPFAESRERFQECLEILHKAWTQDGFSHEGKYYQLKNVSLVPKPYQKPYPPIRMAAATGESLSAAARLGLPIFVIVPPGGIGEVQTLLEEYRRVWRETGRPGTGDVMVRMAVYVARTTEQAISDLQSSTMAFYGRWSAGRARYLPDIGYEDYWQNRLVCGTPEYVADRLLDLKKNLGLSGVLAEGNPGGAVPPELVANSIRLCGDEVMPRLG